MTDEEYGKAMDWLHKHVVYVEPNEDKMTIDSLLRFIVELKKKDNIDGFILDPWNEVHLKREHGEKDVDCISRTLTRCRWLARRLNIAFMIIAHPTKLEKAQHGEYKGLYPPPMPYDIYGGSCWYNKADMALTVYKHGREKVTEIHITKVKFRGIHGRPGLLKYKWLDPPGWFFTEKEADAYATQAAQPKLF
jgi:hypothetical protein